MHESSIVEYALQAVTKHAVLNGITEVKCIRLTIGVQRGVLKDALQHIFKIISAQSVMFCSCSLIIDEVPAVVVCQDCGTQSVCGEIALKCPVCSSINIQIVDGNDLRVYSFQGI